MSVNRNTKETCQSKMTLLEEILKANEAFVKNEEFKAYKTDKTPNKKAVFLTCMDTRLSELATKAFGLKNGDIKQLKNAGAVVSHPYGSTMRSILVAVYALGVDEVFIMGHHDCGFGALKPDPVIKEMRDRGISEDTFNTLDHSGIDVRDWLKGFDSVEESVTETVNNVKNHPLLAKSIPVHGLIMDPETGKADLVINGYEKVEE